MNPLSIEVRCALDASDARWNEIELLTLEIGYPGLNGETMWKHIGWVQEQKAMIGKSFVHALWSRNTQESVLIFDFHPVIPPQTGVLEKTFLVRTGIKHPDGREENLKPQLLDGPAKNDFFFFQPQYPNS